MKSDKIEIWQELLRTEAISKSIAKPNQYLFNSLASSMSFLKSILLSIITIVKNSIVFFPSCVIEIILKLSWVNRTEQSDDTREKCPMCTELLRSPEHLEVTVWKKIPDTGAQSLSTSQCKVQTSNASRRDSV